MVLIFSIKYDFSTTYVMRWLAHLGVGVVRINGDDETYKFSAIAGKEILFQNTITGETVDLMQADACWWRRTGITSAHLRQVPVPEELHIAGVDVGNFVKGVGNNLSEEGKALKEYISYSLYRHIPLHLGKPLFNLNRLMVCDIAQKYGLLIPPYQVIHNGRQMAEAQRDLGPLVTKSIANGIYRDIDQHRFYTYTELLEQDFINDNIDNQFFPSLVTACVEKQLEIRSFYLAGQFFSMAIFSQSDEKTKIDFRKYTNNRSEPYQLPAAIEDKLELIYKELDLNCGSADLILDKSGNYIFLEINPVGQFGMTSEPCNYNLHQIIAKYLIDGRIHKTASTVREGSDRFAPVL
jgi:ATP-GRASP peptide maturase of grasp-with-spasm system